MAPNIPNYGQTQVYSTSCLSTRLQKRVLKRKVLILMFWFVYVLA